MRFKNEIEKLTGSRNVGSSDLKMENVGAILALYLIMIPVAIRAEIPDRCSA